MAELPHNDGERDKAVETATDRLQRAYQIVQDSIVASHQWFMRAPDNFGLQVILRSDPAAVESAVAHLQAGLSTDDLKDLLRHAEADIAEVRRIVDDAPRLEEVADDDAPDLYPTYVEHLAQRLVREKLMIALAVRTYATPDDTVVDNASRDKAIEELMDEDATDVVSDGELAGGGDEGEAEFAVPELAAWREHEDDGDDAASADSGRETLSWDAVPNADAAFNGYTGNAETEEQIYVEAETAVVDMQRITNEFNHLHMVVSEELERVGAKSFSPEYDLRLCNVMNLVNKASGGKITVEVLVSILFDEDIIEQLEALDIEERRACIQEVFRTVAVEALMEVQLFSDMCDAKTLSADDEDDEERNDEVDELTDYYVGQLMKRQGIL